MTGNNCGDLSRLVIYSPAGKKTMSDILRLGEQKNLKKRNKRKNKKRMKEYPSSV